MLKFFIVLHELGSYSYLVESNLVSQPVFGTDFIVVAPFACPICDAESYCATDFVCRKCLAGFYTDKANQTFCNLCEPNTWSSVIGATLCENKCPENSKSPYASKNISDCKCDDNYYASYPSSKNKSCISCPFEGICLNESEPIAKTGYWKINNGK